MQFKTILPLSKILSDPGRAADVIQRITGAELQKGSDRSIFNLGNIKLVGTSDGIFGYEVISEKRPEIKRILDTQCAPGIGYDYARSIFSYNGRKIPKAFSNIQQAINLLVYIHTSIQKNCNGFKLLGDLKTTAQDFYPTSKGAQNLQDIFTNYKGMKSDLKDFYAQSGLKSAVNTGVDKSKNLFNKGVQSFKNYFNRNNNP